MEMREKYRGLAIIWLPAWQSSKKVAFGPVYWLRTNLHYLTEYINRWVWGEEVGKETSQYIKGVLEPLELNISCQTLVPKNKKKKGSIWSSTLSTESSKAARWLQDYFASILEQQSGGLASSLFSWFFPK